MRRREIYERSIGEIWDFTIKILYNEENEGSHKENEIMCDMCAFMSYIVHPLQTTKNMISCL